MINIRTSLRWIRRAVLGVFVLLFIISAFAVIAVDRGKLTDLNYATLFSVNGAVGYVSRKSIEVGPLVVREIPDGSQKVQPWKPRFGWLVNQQVSGISYRQMFNWTALGFHYTSEGIPARGITPSVWVLWIGVPYWPLLLILALPEIGPALRRARARVIRNMPQPQTRQVKASTIMSDLPCVHCGYNLQTLQTTGLCPECGSAVVDTLTLSAELARSRPSWLKCLAWGNVLLLLTRVLLILVYVQFMPTLYGPRNYTTAGTCAVAAAALYMIGTFLLTLNEHPFLRSPDRAAALRQRIGAIIVFACVGAAVYHQAFLPSSRPWTWLFWSGGGFWHFPTIFLLLVGWLLYCACTTLEYRFLGRLAGRLLDRFMTEHCTIAGIGAGITNLLALWIVRDVVMNTYARADLPYFIFVGAVMIVWIMFLLWTGFMNVYCAARFMQQAWLAEENWRMRQTISDVAAS